MDFRNGLHCTISSRLSSLHPSYRLFFVWSDHFIYLPHVIFGLLQLVFYIEASIPGPISVYFTHSLTLTIQLNFHLLIITLCPFCPVVTSICTSVILSLIGGMYSIFSLCFSNLAIFHNF